MKKNAVFLLFVLLFGASCQQESPNNESDSVVQEVVVQFNLALRQEITSFQTRAIPGNVPDEPTDQNDGDETDDEGELVQPATTLNYVDYAIYDSEGDFIRYARKDINVTPDGTAQFTLQETFTAGVYTVCFLAHSVEDAGFTQVDNWVTFPEVNDTFWGSDEIEIDATETNQSFNISIQRVIAGVEFNPTDPVPESVHHFDIETSFVYNTINLWDGTVAADKTIELEYSYQFTEADREEDARVGHIFYTFVPENAVSDDAESALIDDVTISALTEEDRIVRTRIITDVPIYRNKITRYTGTLYTAKLVDTEFIIDIESGWDGYENEILPDEE